MSVIRHRVALAGLVSNALVGAACSSTSSPQVTTEAGALVTFHEHVEPLLQKRCQTCHHAGGIAPMAFTDYATTKPYAELMVHETQERAMPPWGAAETAECRPPFKFRNDGSLTAEELETLRRWQADGAPEGDPTRAPAPRTFEPETVPGATHTASIPPFQVSPSTSDELRCFPLDLGLLDDTWFDAIQVVPGDPQVVHHVLVYTDPSGTQAKALAGADTNYPCFGGPSLDKTSLVMAWAPGVAPVYYPQDVGFRLTKGTHLVVQVHYHPAHAGITALDQTKVVLRQKTTVPSWLGQIYLLGNADKAQSETNPLLWIEPDPTDAPTGPGLFIPAGAKNHVETMGFRVPPPMVSTVTNDLRIGMVASHMHYLGKDLKITLERGPLRQPTEAESSCLLQTPYYDFNWQRAYEYDAPIEQLPILRAGDVLKIRCTYDNSLDNELVSSVLKDRGLATPVDVKLGESTLDEMCLGAFVTYQKL